MSTTSRKFASQEEVRREFLAEVSSEETDRLVSALLNARAVVKERERALDAASNEVLKIKAALWEETVALARAVLADPTSSPESKNAADFILIWN